MKRFWLQWCLSRALDEDKPLPDWLVRELDRDARLRAYFEQAQRLSEALRRDAPNWMEPHVPSRSLAHDTMPTTMPMQRRDRHRDVDREPLRNPTTRWSGLTVAGLAATLLIGYLMLLRTPSHEPRPTSPHFATTSPDVADRHLLESVENARVLVQWIDAGRRAASPWTESTRKDALREAKLPALQHRLAKPYAIAQRVPETIGRCSEAIGSYLREEPRKILLALKRAGSDLGRSTLQCSQRLHSLWRPSI